MSERSTQALIAIRQIQRKIEQSSRQLAKTGGLTPSQLKVLQMLAERNEELSVGWVSDQTRLKAATITSLVDRLEERGMVSRRRCDTDRRRVWIAIEPAGLEALNVTPDYLQEVFERRFEKLEDWQKSMLVASLELTTRLLDAENIDAAAILDLSNLIEKADE
ncbi:MAG: MarR family transcriptional regulator [Ponticaulis sp.]|nr:MarR family transcriptional regulator [Ponticaulis sp.]|tara:strand:- start:6605 stop:7093 length:489 start_codon:yes stop_codon:yes gene_type:complete